MAASSNRNLNPDHLRVAVCIFALLVLSTEDQSVPVEKVLLRRPRRGVCPLFGEDVAFGVVEAHLLGH